MRIRVLGRFIAALAILTFFLCLLPASTQVAVAKPIGWNETPPPDFPKTGDNDGVVLKSGTLKSNTGSATGTWGAKSTTTTAGSRYVTGGLRGYYAVLKLSYWLFWVR
jgi:hypothetical protein